MYYIFGFLNLNKFIIFLSNFLLLLFLTTLLLLALSALIANILDDLIIFNIKIRFVANFLKL